ncbi:unnamed protein product, partial [Discosporangium mesarthrocarpum]
LGETQRALQGRSFSCFAMGCMVHAVYRCQELEDSLSKLRSENEGHKEVVATLRREVMRAYEHAESAKKQAGQSSRTLAMLEEGQRSKDAKESARMVAAQARQARRRDLLRMQASAHDDLHMTLASALGAQSHRGEGEGLHVGAGPVAGGGDWGSCPLFGE